MTPGSPVRLEEGRRLLVEGTSLFTPLGIRFWDKARDQQVTDGLDVTAVTERGSGRVYRAFRTASAVYAFEGLPGLPEVQRGSDVDAAIAPRRRFVVRVVDHHRRFVDMSFRVALPLFYKGIFLVHDPDGFPGGNPPGLGL